MYCIMQHMYVQHIHSWQLQQFLVKEAVASSTEKTFELYYNVFTISWIIDILNCTDLDESLKMVNSLLHFTSSLLEDDIAYKSSS